MKPKLTQQGEDNPKKIKTVFHKRITITAIVSFTSLQCSHKLGTHLR